MSEHPKKKPKLDDSTKDKELSAEEVYEQGMYWYRIDYDSKAVPLFEKAADMKYPPALLRLHIIMNTGYYSTNTKYKELCKQFKPWFLERSLSGNAIDQYHYGLYLDKIEGNRQEAATWMLKAAEQGFTPAQCNVGVFFSKLKPEESIVWCLKAAEQNYAQAESLLSKKYGEGDGVDKDLSKSFYWLMRAAEHGCADSEYRVGMCYKNGTGVEVDEKKAVHWFEKAADKGEPDGEFALGSCYEAGFGVPVDLEKALEWYRMAAEKCNTNACFKLALMYQNGKGVKKDHSKAIYWYQKGAEHEYPNSDCCCNLGNFYIDGNGVPKDVQKGLQLLRMSADLGHSLAQYNIAAYYLTDLAQADYTQALYWLQKAVQSKCSVAYQSLGMCYEMGHGVRRDPETAVSLYQQGSDLGHDHAQYCLGLCYFIGKGIKQDLQKAADWFLKAAQQGSIKAQKKMSELYEYGDGVPQNHKEAMEWAKKSHWNLYVVTRLQQTHKVCKDAKEEHLV